LGHDQVAIVALLRRSCDPAAAVEVLLVQQFRPPVGQVDLERVFLFSQRRSHTHLATQCGILLPVFRALVFGLALCFGESINLT
jgi:hypothetical protein